MSKIIYLNLFKTVTVALFVFAVFLPGSIAWGQNPVPHKEWVVDVRVLVSSTGAVYANTSFPIYADCYYASEEKDGTTWDDAQYTTSKHNHDSNPRYLSHFAVGGLKYPDSVTVRHNRGTSKLINRAAIIAAVDRYWEHRLYRRSAYNKVSSADPSMNCHGYSTGKSVVMVSDSFQKLVTDDWTKYFLVADLPPEGGAVYGNDSHSIKIDGATWESVDAGEQYKVAISEKFRDSGVYTTSFKKKIHSNGEIELVLKNLTDTVIFNHFYKRN